MVDTIIVNFRTKELTLDAVQSVVGEPETGRVIVVENGSGDDSATWLQDRLDPGKTQLVVSLENLGFGGGNNLGAGHAESEYLFLLNSDATLVAGGLRKLVDGLRRGIGVAAPEIALPGGVNVQPDTYGPFPTPLRLLTGRTRNVLNPARPDWVSGCAMLVLREDFLELGGFDEALFMYFEDVDLCKRYADRGLPTVRVPEAKVIHLGGASRASSQAQKIQSRRSMDLYLKKHGFSSAARGLVKITRTIRAYIRGQ